MIFLSILGLSGLNYGMDASDRYKTPPPQVRESDAVRLVQLVGELVRARELEKRPRSTSLLIVIYPSVGLARS